MPLIRICNNRILKGYVISNLYFPSVSFQTQQFYYIAPYLYPITNTLMTCSSYMTVAVAVNRYLDIISTTRTLPRLNNGYKQALIVFVAAAAVNAPRWLEFSCCKFETVSTNVTDEETGEVSIVNSTVVYPILNPIRNKYEYIRDYTLISCNVLTLLLPMILMLISSVLIYHEMAKATRATGGVFSDAQEAARRRRNRSVTLMLFGIIVLFITCRVGEFAISMYELFMMVRNGERKDFPEYIRAIVSINNLLLVCNSSLNFAIYCKDVLFRYVFCAT